MLFIISRILHPTFFLDIMKGFIMDVDQPCFETFDDFYLFCYRS